VKRLRPLLVALAATAALATPGSAQSVRDKALIENPTRNVGGSCIFDGNGKLLHAPRGAICAALEQADTPPASPAPEVAEAPRARAPVAAPAAKLGPQAREQVGALLAERERLDVELARIREAIAYEDREAARNMVEESLRTIGRHLEHEARVLQPLAASAP
jgi:hypothetical protein